MCRLAQTRRRGLTLAQTGHRGLTLVEVLIALALLAVALLPVMIGFSQALVTTSQSSITTAATSLARDKVEELKARVFADVASEPRAVRDLRPGDSFFEVEVAVDTLRPDGTAHEGLKQAVVTVYRRGGTRPVASITTYFTSIGI